MISVDEMYGAGFTMIVEDMAALNDLEPQSQEQINIMFEEIREVLNRHNLDICIVASQEDAKRFQGRLLITDMINAVDKLCKEGSEMTHE
jgi:proline racemase